MRALRYQHHLTKVGTIKKFFRNKVPEGRAQCRFKPRRPWVTHCTLKLCQVTKWRIGQKKSMIRLLWLLDNNI